MNPSEIITFIVGAVVTIVVSGYLGGWKARQEIKNLAADEQKKLEEIKNIKIDRERTLGQIIEEQDEAIKQLREEDAKNRAAAALKDVRMNELERKFNDLSAYVGELLAGIDMLIEQITVKHGDTPVWRPNRRRDSRE